MTPATLSSPTPPPLPDVATFLDQIRGGQGPEALRSIAQHMMQGGVAGEVVTELLAPAQREVGERWHAGAWTVADEHTASAVVEDALGVIAAHQPRTTGAQRLTVVCAEGEWHVTPARMAAIALRDSGWHVDFLGGSTPTEHLRAGLVHTRPHVLAVSATLPLALAGVPAIVELAHDIDVPVLAGGRAFGRTDHRARLLGADGHAPDLARATPLLRAWQDHPPVAARARPDPDWRAQHQMIVDHHDDLLAAAFARLEQRLPAMQGFTPSQLDHTRRDLSYTLRFLATALLVEDAGLFDEYAGWLGQLLGHRGVPADVLRVSFEAVADALATRDLDLARDMLVDS